ncbi:MAG: AI-2E family transporter [Verrucomicrobia bacterium]|nr:AI-2E family transporter [Verrucomicrobiota bacterium]
MIPEYPTPWQRRTIWAALTALAVSTLISIFVGGIWVATNVLSFLQPLLVPFAISGVLAYLLEPVVGVLSQRAKMSRSAATVTIFGAIVVGLSLLAVTVIPSLYRQSVDVAKKMPGYARKLQQKVPEWIDSSQDKLREIGEMIPGRKPAPPPSLPPQASSAGTEPAASPSPAKKNPLDADSVREYIEKQVGKLEDQIPNILNSVWNLIGRGIGGFLGIFGFLISAVIVPFCLWYFLKEGDHIKKNWGDYLPLAPSPFKDEVVGVLSEMNGYLVAFFRGQLIISLIDGALIGIALLIVGIDFALLIGLLVVFLSLIPYLGIILCYIPAVLIAVLQFGDWQHPLAVTIVFVAVQQFEGFFIAPRIQSETVGLHPLTIILSVVGWSLLLGGLLGALLAVPLSAMLKVLLRRYVWSRRERSVLTIPGETDENGSDLPPRTTPRIILPDR